MNQVAKSRGAFYSGMLLSLALVWCMSIGAAPARAAADAAVQPASTCACCNSAPGIPECASVCNTPQHTAIKDFAPPPSPSLVLSTTDSAFLEWDNVAAPRRAVRTPVAGPPLYLKLHRLLK